MSSIMRGESKISNIDVERFKEVGKQWAENNGFSAEIEENQLVVRGSGTYDFATFSWEAEGNGFGVTYDSDFRESQKVINGVQGTYIADVFKATAKKYGFSPKSEEQTESETKLSMIGY